MARLKEGLGLADSEAMVVFGGGVSSWVNSPRGPSHVTRTAETYTVPGVRSVIYGNRGVITDSSHVGFSIRIDNLSYFFFYAREGLFKGCTHRVTEALQWLSMSRYRCIKRVCRSVATLLCCDSVHSSKWLSMEKAFWFLQTSNMSKISFAMGMFSCQIAQWEHLFSMDFDNFLTIYLIF